MSAFQVIVDMCDSWLDRPVGDEDQGEVLKCRSLAEHVPETLVTFRKACMDTDDDGAACHAPLSLL